MSAYHLGHLTNPPRPIHASLKYHWVHVVELAALDSIRPDPVLERYHDRWAAYKPPVAPRKPAPRPPQPPQQPPPQPVVSDARLVRPVRAGMRRVAVRFALSAPSTVTLALARRIDGRWRVRGERTLARGAGEHTVGVYRRGQGPLRAGAFRVVVAAGPSVARVRFRCAQRSRSSGSSSWAAASRSSSRI